MINFGIDLTLDFMVIFNEHKLRQECRLSKIKVLNDASVLIMLIFILNVMQKTQTKKDFRIF